MIGEIPKCCDKEMNIGETVRPYDGKFMEIDRYECLTCGTEIIVKDAGSKWLRDCYNQNDREIREWLDTH